MRTSTIKDIDSYIAQYPKEIQSLLQKMRTTISKAAPGAKEAIKYGIPTFVLNGNVVHFGAFAKHIGFFPTSSGVSAFKKELKSYGVSKGAIRFPMNEPIPWTLVTKITKFRVKESKGND